MTVLFVEPFIHSETVGAHDEMLDIIDTPKFRI